jgi:hypothetical protein
MTKTYAEHMNNTFWNTLQGQFPVNKVWAKRFLVDRSDPSRGPVNPKLLTDTNKHQQSTDSDRTDGQFFTIDGLEGKWIPYGGGFAAYPGKNLAKSLILYTKFSLKVQSPKHPIRFQIKKRKHSRKSQDL